MDRLNGVHQYGRPEMGDCIILRGTTVLWTDHYDRYSDDWAPETMNPSA